MNPSTLPGVPVKHADFISHVQSHPNVPLPELLEPYKQYDAKLREVFAQETNHPALADEHLNVVPVFNGYEKDVKVRARNLESESDEEKKRYVMPLDEADRRPNGSPAIVQDIKDFQQNFALFCESSLVDLNWSNVVAAGSSVVTSLLPVPDKYKKSKRALRQYYHEMIAPASDVDLFIYGLNEEEAVKKIIAIEQQIKDSILTETTTIRTKNAITIASQYPTRHIQIVLRIYKSVSEILTGFDVDCSCAAYDGKQVWAAPRALTAYMTQTNTIDLTRRSPSYENRLSKYSHRGFEVYWPLLERSRIDPTIFERNFARTVGLARLLVLERLPSKSEREAYMDERRRERGRPAINRFFSRAMRDNIKEKYEDEVAEWVDQDDVSDYHTFTIPYGPKYHAKKIEKLLYTKDLLLNAEWNVKEREVNLHRHPAFFGFAEDVIHDCCGFCPKPVTPEEHDVAEEEAKVYVSGEISFIKDDPGRQAIGSFNPITDDDWTEMAYVGNTARLCQAIIDEDLEHVQDWLSQEGADPNCRDYTGRTPLHLAVMCSSPEVVRTLIEHGARLVARLADGRTALHLAAARGNTEMVKLILQKSEENEEEEAKNEDIRKQARMAAREGKDVKGQLPISSDEDDNDLEIVEKDDDSDDDARTTTTGSYVKVKDEEKDKIDDVVPEEDEKGPDVYDVNVVAWDTRCSPLHLAILNGHTEVVRELVQTFGADVLLPIKLFNDWDKSARGAILNLILCVSLPLEKAKAMTITLLELGASSAQADTSQTTALHYISGEKPELLETLVQHDEPAAKRAINHLAVTGYTYRPSAKSPLVNAIKKRNAIAALKLLEAGATPSIELKDWLKSVEAQFDHFASHRDSQSIQQIFKQDIEQPIILAILNEMPNVALQLLDMGADIDTLTKDTAYGLQHGYSYNIMESLVDLVRRKLTELKEWKDTSAPEEPSLQLREGVNHLDGLEPDTYKHFITQVRLIDAQASDESSKYFHEQQLKTYRERKGVEEKKAAIKTLTNELEALEQALVSKGAKTFKELHPDFKGERDGNNYHPWTTPPQPPFEVKFGFRASDLTDETREAYVRLFQAVWEGDVSTVKSLTLGTWGESNKTPLKVTVSDDTGFTPFSLAVLRNHLGLARAIVEISDAQYESPEEEEPKTRYRLNNEDDDDESDTSDVPIYREIIDEQFTIDNIGELSSKVKSDVTPIACISGQVPVGKWAEVMLPDRETKWTGDRPEIKRHPYLAHSLQGWAIINDDKDLFAFLLDLDVEWTDRLAKKLGNPSLVTEFFDLDKFIANAWENRLTRLLDDSSGIPTFSDAEFSLAIKYGRIEKLAEMIKHGGAGMKLESLVQKSGVKYKEKPKYYQGLSVHGKKRPAWVQAARGTYTESTADSSPPLLEAAFKGSLQSVEWFLSDTPARHYLDFAEAYKGDKFIDHLNKNAGGFEKVLKNWLDARSELVLHCAVMAKQNEETYKLIKYLIEVMPESLEVKSSDGYTPLALAFSLQHLEAAKILIEAGADQTVRDYAGSNILHLLLCPAYNNAPADDHEKVKSFLEIVDKRLVPSLLIERSSRDPGSLTPFAGWVRSHSSDDGDMLRTLLDFASFTGNEHLELLDASGDTPLHYIVKFNKRKWLEIVLEFRPDLLNRENSVGRTPCELAEDAYIADCVRDPPGQERARRFYNYHDTIVNRPVESFDPNKEERNTSKERIWRVCKDFAKKNPMKRRLVSLVEANEVAKRLATRKSGRQSTGGVNEGAKSEADSEFPEEKDDAHEEVQKWYREAHTGQQTYVDNWNYRSSVRGYRRRKRFMSRQRFLRR